MKKNNKYRDSLIFKEVLNGQTYTAMAQVHQLSLSRPPQIVKRIMTELLNKSKEKGISHPFTFNKYPHAYEPSLTKDLFTQDVAAYLLQPKDLHAEKEFLLALHSEIN